MGLVSKHRHKEIYIPLAMGLLKNLYILKSILLLNLEAYFFHKIYTREQARKYEYGTSLEISAKRLFEDEHGC